MSRRVSITGLHPDLRMDRTGVRRLIRILDANAGLFQDGCPPGDLSLVFMTDEALGLLHDRFLKDPTVTDVITFEGDPALGTAGEICVSADAAVRQVGQGGGAGRIGRARKGGPVGEARAAGRREALRAELALYLVHGWLHLAGYDDLRPAAKRIMRRAEARAMRLVREAGGPPRFALKSRG